MRSIGCMTSEVIQTWPPCAKPKPWKTSIKCVPELSEMAALSACAARGVESNNTVTTNATVGTIDRLIVVLGVRARGLTRQAKGERARRDDMRVARR